MRSKGKMKFIVMSVLFIAIMVSTCKKEDENHHRRIVIINNSEKDIYACCDGTYPDTLGDVGGLTSNPDRFKVKAHTNNRNAIRMISGAFWEDVFKYGNSIPSDTLMVFILDAALLESRHGRNAIIQRYDLSLQDLQHVNWTLYYPPSPNMSAIKMYPPYGQ